MDKTKDVARNTPTSKSNVDPPKVFASQVSRLASADGSKPRLLSTPNYQFPTNEEGRAVLTRRGEKPMPLLLKRREDPFGVLSSKVLVRRTPTKPHHKTISPIKAHTVDEFALILLNYLKNTPQALSFAQLKAIVLSFKQEFGQFLGVGEEGSAKVGSKEEGVWDFLAHLEKQRNNYGAHRFDNRKTNQLLHGILQALQLLTSQKLVQQDPELKLGANRLIAYIVHYQNREGDPFVAAQNIIDLIVSGKIAQVNQPSLVKTLGDIRHAMKQYFEGNLKVPLLRMLDKQTQNSGGTNTAPDHRQTNAFMHKLKRGLATIQGAYKGKQPFVAQLTTEVLGLINRYEHRDLTPKKEIKIEKEERIVDPVTTQYASETNYAMYQVIGELIDNPKYRKIFELPTKLQDKRLKVIIEEIRKKHNYQSILDVNGKVNFDYDARQEVLRRFSEWSLRKKGKSLEKQLFKSREDAFNAAKAEAKTILTKTDKVVWQANDQLTALYHQGVVGLIQRRMLSLEKLLGKTNWKQLFKEAGLYALLDKINFQEGAFMAPEKNTTNLYMTM
ncbi:hypothetical protein [Microscilla marina]|uniref:Uncharacterized protein n=1 Tax=Microscilla marina ATCC 23134 TaxID=313606 RepID=A1ZX40_MICM2|nr:hypothetical protein [Microscilla marina]EAY25021.1 hypothetical protein M23134_07210 [Microscilla marina ATCC 23134]